MGDKKSDKKKKMSEDKFILMDLDDERIGDVAEVLKSKISKKILDFLGDIREASEKDIAGGLDVPINTIEYNLKKLIKSGFIKKSKNFFWSVKGRKIDLYKLANKHVIIGTKKPNFNYLKTVFPIFLVLLVFVIAGALLILNTDKNSGVADEGNLLKQFSSQQEMNQFLKENSEAGSLFGNFYQGLSRVGKSNTIAPEVSFAESVADGSGGATDYSTTNIQVEGVDEADIVKNDGKYIYVVSGSKIEIIEAYPTEEMRIIKELKLNGSINDIFINKNKLIVFGGEYKYVPHVGEAEIAVDCAGPGCGRGYSVYETLVYIYDISDKENPVLENKIGNDGSYVQSRMIGDYVYVISTKYVNIEQPRPPVYWANGVEKITPVNEIYYFDYPDTSYVFSSILAIDINSGEFTSKVYLTGSTRNIYVPQDNIYLTYEKRLSYADFLDEMVEEVYYPLLPISYKNKIKDILDSNKEDYDSLNEISQIIKEYSNSLKGEEKARFDSDLLEKMDNYQRSLQKKLENTMIHKININKLDVDYIGVGEVPGHILNQFSMDEYGGYFRIATTTQGFGGGTSLNHLYVLDENLEIVGSVEDLAPGERIYSSRFLGKRAYLVTFRNTDPFYVIDLSNPRKPEVLGYLKIPGYSDYLHPYDENHIIGIGKNTVEASADFAWYQGIKISLFDVSDVENPIEKSNFIIGDRGTDSDVLYEHKAFLFDREKQLLVIPIRLHKINESKYMNEEGEIPDNAYGDFVWQGAYVLNIDKNNLSLRGKISHDNETELEKQGRFYYGNYQTAIHRTLYINDILYTISQYKVKANDINTMDESNFVEWEGNKQDYGYFYSEKA